jgi:glycosyltransferase involved in cell wall biosynthesis
MSPPSVTALIDTYNHERYISEAIESFLAQDFPCEAMEIVVVDDGSTDRTAARIRKFGRRVRYIRKKNGSQASALNLGFQSSRGEILAMLDGDDVWLPQKVRRVVEEFEKNPAAGMVCHPYEFWTPAENRLQPDLTFCPVSGYLPDSPIAMRQFGGFGTCSMALRRNLASELFPVPRRLKVFAYCFLIAGAIFLATVASIPECLTRYRHHGENLTSIEESEVTKLARRNRRFRAARQEIARWFAARGFDRTHPAGEVLLRRMELVQRQLEFSLKTPGRGQYFNYLSDHDQVYALLWTAPQRFAKRMAALAGFMLGYENFLKLRAAFSG